MWLLNVRAVLDRERDIQLAEPKTKVLEQHDDKTAKYAILSHRWGKEIDYDEMTGLLKMDKQDRDAVRRRDGYQKILKSCKQADDDGYEWLWIDTCCIDKRSSAELSEAINSMYRWYRNSQICYVYLNDVSEPAFPAVQDFMRFPESNGWPEWFSRGWTLQELIAPTKLKFFNKSWELIGTKEGLTSTLQDITRIPEEVLKDAQVLRSIDSSERPRTAQIMAWAADRTTTRVEDRAYSLLGLFGVNMPMLYGEGSKAFQRLQLEIIRISSDHSIFAWNPKREFRQSGSVLAAGPSSFQGCHNIENVHRKEFVNGVKAYMGKSGFHVNSNYYTPMEAHVNSPQFSIFNVTNVGIQVSLPVIPHRGASDGHFKAILPCRDRLGNLITIDLEPHGLNSCRSFWAIRIADDTWPGFTSFYLNFSREGDADESYHDLRLDDWHTSWHGFTRRGTFPSEVSDNTVTLSPGNNLIVLVYVNNDARSRFAVGIGYCLGRVWTHVSSDESRAKEGVLSSWTDFAMQTYDVLWNTPIHEFYRNIRNTVRDAHIPRSIWDARIACRSSDQGYTDVMIGVKWCPGCCTGPREFTHTSLSDHGHPFDGSFNSRSNISRDMREVRINDWHRGLACEQRRKRYQNIRGHFDALAELLPYRFVGTKACDESVVRWKTAWDP
ncbi:heterokaryon incompatibility protein-domain-containing protein [Pisolithus orientalis]|uniref:heterokaryon incompatibility protein-domain-containing protein n=1 Tax=Pisolithus orientalis TaxID=936130 RepID=UPI002224DD5E|nr:heterokaryon incompatibility protein-domain-containing protein [Pisolithus orientalis]KAI5997870.1 heterokaryon incompatibility protein-domain-containing protein [Pisolithus orientalis]